jgi:murein DD-endopeptidase MepM/ murein hydrolase activator NlpD
VSLLPPKRLRVLLIPENQSTSREFIISRTMVLALALLTVSLVALVVFILVSYGSLAQKVERLPKLEQDLAWAQACLATVRELKGELQQMGSLQERLLVMLGVQAPSPAAQDTLAGWFTWGEVTEGSPMEVASTGAGGLEQAAALLMTPPPDLWPATGFVTREFSEGRPAFGELPHHGIDIAGPADSEVRAAGKGQVIRARWDDFLGNFVELRFGTDLVT